MNGMGFCQDCIIARTFFVICKDKRKNNKEMHLKETK